VPDAKLCTHISHMGGQTIAYKRIGMVNRSAKAHHLISYGWPWTDGTTVPYKLTETRTHDLVVPVHALVVSRRSSQGESIRAASRSRIFTDPNNGQDRLYCAVKSVYGSMSLARGSHLSTRRAGQFEAGSFVRSFVHGVKTHTFVQWKIFDYTSSHRVDDR